MSRREIVVPGELLAKNKESGENTYRKGNSVFSKIYGFKEEREDYVEVLPANIKYSPSNGDKVIGIVEDVNFNNWYLDINCPYDARLAVEQHPTYIESGELESHLKIGDTVIVEVTEVDKDMNINVKMNEEGLKKIKEGRLIEISPSKVPRVIGKDASMISMLKRESNCNIYVGQNGRIWINGEREKAEKVKEAIKIIEEKAHTSGLTDKIKNFMQN
ncbi:RNA-binding protein [archaeon SCG-AAA382B04]|nr:RNA-binding protein [archaeon SCG-AAA382B04]